MAYKEIEQCKLCGQDFVVNSEEYYWHIKTHQAKQEAGIPEQFGLPEQLGKEIEPK